jgi:hypothetical protein
MARPWRRVLIQLSIRLGISIREVESWDMRTIREFIAVLTENGKPTDDKKLREQSPEELEAALRGLFGKPG